MRVYTPKPTTGSITRPACLKCGERMMLARVAPSSFGVDYRTFECPACGEATSEIVTPFTD